MARSYIEELALLSPNDRFAVLNELERKQPGATEAMLHDWAVWGRPEQQEPGGHWLIWYIEAGRGSGKTRSAAECIHKKVNAGHARYGALVHRTAADVRDVVVEGESGILATAKPGKMPKYEPSKRRVTWPNGTMFTCYSAEEPDQLRGPTHDLAWGDEFAVWRGTTGVDGLTAFDNLRFSMRGTHNPNGAQLVLTTTPKRVPSVKQMHNDASNPKLGIVITKGTLYDNLANLAPSFVEAIMAKYAGTALGEQEIEGRLARTVEGAIFTEQNFEATRVLDLRDLPSLGRPVVSVDPSVGDGSGDECGIVVTALSAGTLPTSFTHNGLTLVRNVTHGYILDDASLSGPPDVWAQRVSEVAAKHGTTTIVAEANQGGKMVESVIRNVNQSLQVHLVHASQGKEVRAQPLAALFAQGRWHVVGYLPEMEDQMSTWIPGSGRSPDRLDAAVWGQAYLEPSIGYEIKEPTTPVDLQVARMARVAGRRQW